MEDYTKCVICKGELLDKPTTPSICLWCQDDRLDKDKTMEF